MATDTFFPFFTIFPPVVFAREVPTPSAEEVQ